MMAMKRPDLSYLWLDYKEKHPDGYQLSQFYQLYKEFLSENFGQEKVSMPVERIPRERMSYEASQIFFHILILNAIYHLTFSSIKGKLSGNRTIAVLGPGALLRVNQMAILLRNGFLTVLDLENPAGF